MVVALAVNTLIVLGTFLIVSTAFAGVGLLIRWASGLKATDVNHYFLAFWTGFGGVLLLLIVWNFFLPVGMASLITVLALGGLGWWVMGIPAELRSTDAWRPSVLQVVLFMLAGLWVANQSTAGLTSWDDGLYHLQGVQWAETYPVVRGIANLLGPLAFNNASFLYDAMLDSGWWKDRAFHTANGVLLFMMVLQASVAGARFASGRSDQRMGVQLYRFLLLAPSLYLVRDGDLVSFSTDIPATLTLFAASGVMFELLDTDATQDRKNGSAYPLTALTILFAAAVCVKMTTAVFVAVGMSLTLLLWWKRRVGSGRLASTLAGVTLITASFALPWMARGVLMSGYPLFPLSLAGFPVAWRAPLEQAKAEYAYIEFSEREFTWGFIGRKWLRQVFLHDIYAVLIPACLAALVILALIFSKSLRDRMRKVRRDTRWLLLPALVAIAVWLVTAPSTRYSPALFWILAASVVCEFMIVFWQQFGMQSRRRAATGLLLLGVSPVFVAPAVAAIEKGDSVVVALFERNVITPEPGQWIPPIAQPPEVIGYTTRSGLALNVPRKTQGSTVLVKCWNAPLPCTPTPAPNLRLIESGRLEKGFRVEGGWEMQDWPAYWQREFLPRWRATQAGTDVAH